MRYARPVTVPDSKTQQFEVGVAFIGKRPPRSYETDPAKRYDIGESTGESFKAGEDWIPIEQSASDKRTSTRHNIPVDMLIETLNDKGEVDQSEQTVTENISQEGAAIYTTLSLPIGRFIRLSSEQFKLTVHAAIRGKSMGPSGVPRIHVEFIDREWPI